MTWLDSEGGLHAFRNRSGEVDYMEDIPGGIVGYSVDGGSLVIEFIGTLKSAASVTGPFVDVGGASSPYTVTADQDAAFFIAE